MKPTVAVIFGGVSSEHEVSLQSAAAVAKAVNPERYNVVTVGITQTGKWLLYKGDTEKIADGTWQQHTVLPVVLSPDRAKPGLWMIGDDGAVGYLSVDIALPVLHGKNGEDGTMQGLLQLSGIPFCGCGVLSSAMCMDKSVANRIATAAGIRCAKQRRFTHYTRADEAICQKVQEEMQGIDFPWYIKPVCEGSSFGISCVHTEEQLMPALQCALEYGETFVVEEGIDGREVGCAVLGAGQEAFASVPDMILLQQDMFDYYEKYHLDTAQIQVPAPVDKPTQKKIQQLALRLYALFGCTGFARVDLFLCSNGELVFNEINTIPGFTSHSRYPNMMKQSGLDFEKLIQKVLEGAKAW